jgi:uncharacterized membrane protein
MTHLRTTMVVGLFLLIPVALSFVVLRFLFVALDEILQPWLRLVLPLPLPGAGIIIIVMLVYVAGLVGGNFLGRRVIRFVQSGIQRVPIVNAIYSTSRQLIDSFSGSTDVGFKKVVVVEYPGPRLFCIGFETGSCTNELGEKWALVYIPTAPLPNSGWIALIPQENVYDSDMTVQAAMKMVLSMGITGPDAINRVPVRVDQGLASGTKESSPAAD